MAAPKVLWCLSIRAAPEEEEPIRGELFALTGAFPVVRQRPTERKVWIDCYFTDRARLRLVLRRMARHAPRVRKLAYEDWAESWKKHFGVQRVGKRVVIKPSWKPYRARRSEIVIELDPGLSFGTGQHPTTRFCLKNIERLSPSPFTLPVARSLLDVGTGSGILAIAASKLGYRPVRSLDNDPQAIRVARDNLRQNRVRIPARVGALESLRRAEPFDVVVANLLADVIEAQRRRLASLVAPGGHLIVAGILAREAGAVRRCFRALGFRAVVSETTQNWTGFVFQKPGRGPR